MKKTLALILSVVLVLGILAGCGGGGTGGAPSSAAPESSAPASSEPSGGGDTPSSAAPEAAGDGNVSGLNGKKTKVTAGLSSNVPTLTPLYKINTYSNVILSEVFEHLGQYEEVSSQEFIGVLMKEWTAVDDVTYEIELYDYIYDSAGNHMTANDVKYSVEASQEAGVSAAKYVESVTVTGDYTATIKMTNGMVGLFEEFCQQVWMFTQAAMEASADEMATTPVGTGPYVVKEYISGSYAELEKRDDYGLLLPRWTLSGDLLSL